MIIKRILPYPITDAKDFYFAKDPRSNDKDRIKMSEGTVPFFCDRNGHMLTHRNKKPYECKAEGCGKSYCDARSLRRHTENHHAGSKVIESVSPSSPTTGPHTPNTPGSNPSTPSTPGATSTSNGHGHPALKQLLATEPTQTQQQKVSPRRQSNAISASFTRNEASNVRRKLPN